MAIEPNRVLLACDQDDAIIKPCVYCGNDFRARIRKRGKPHVYCSGKCRDRHRHESASYSCVCVECGISFSGRTKDAIVCSTECKSSRAQRQQKQYAVFRPPAWWRGPRSCTLCGKTFIPTQPNGAQCSGKKSWGKYCSRACGNLARRKAPQEAAVNSCIQCGGAFSGRSDSTLCSDSCRKERQKITMRNRAKAKYVPKTIFCRECGFRFVTTYGNTRRAFCSDPCLSMAMRRTHRATAKALRRQRLRGATETIDPLQVLIRDGWKCQLCGKRTPKKFRGTTDMRAPEVDHIVPLSRGGEHSYRNTQCTCRACNLQKSAGPGGQLRLFG